MSTIKKWLPAVIMMAIIFLLSSIPGKSITQAGLGYDPYQISGHFVFFFILYLTFYRATKSILLSLLLTVIYAVADELHQLYTPGRSSSMKDIITDTLAGVVAGGILWSSYQRLPKILKKLLKA